VGKMGSLFYTAQEYLWQHFAVANKNTAKNLLGFIEFEDSSPYKKENHRFLPKISLKEARTGTYEMKYKTTAEAAMISIHASYRFQTVIGTLASAPLGVVRNVSIAAITLDKAKSSVFCSNKFTFVAGRQIVCQIICEAAEDKGKITAGSYASALQAIVKSSSGEQKHVEVTYSGIDGVFEARFSLYRTGEASVTVEYKSELGYVPINDLPQYVTVVAGPIDVNSTQLECFSSTDVSEVSSCSLSAFDKVWKFSRNGKRSGRFQYSSISRRACCNKKPLKIASF
jgi:hypothetical protein